VIPVDAIFSPVRRVAFGIEPTRVEQATNYDKLTIEIETDGSISPPPRRSPPLVRRSAAWSGSSRASRTLPRAWSSVRSRRPTSASPDLRVAHRGARSLGAAPQLPEASRVDTIGQLVQKSEDDLLAITNFGSKSLEEVLQKLDERGLSLG